MAEWETEKTLTLCKHCLAIAKALVCYEHSFSNRHKAQHRMGCYEET